MNNANILYGMILGDGHLDKPSKRRPSSRLTITQGIKQLGYLEYKSKTLKDLGFENKVRVLNLYPRSPLPSAQLRSRVYPELTEIRAELYSFRNTPDKYRKRITKNILKKCDLITLMYLYLDDGHNRVKGNEISIQTCDFPYEEQELIRDWIYALTGAQMRIYRKKDHFYLSTYKDSDILKQSLLTVFPNIECMQYKFI